MVVRKSIFGLSLSEWAAIIGIALSIFVSMIGLASKISANEARTSNLEKQQTEHRIDLEKTKDNVTEMKGDIKEVNGKLDILLQRTRFK